MAHRPSAEALCTAYASIGLVLVFVWSALSDHVFSLRSALPEFLAVNPRVFFLASILALSAIFALKPQMPRSVETTLGILLPFIGATGTACIALAPNQTLFPSTALCVIGLLALGAGYCWFVVSYGLLLARSGSIKRIVCCLAAALAMEPFVRLFIESTFSQVMRAGIAVALPFLSMVLLELVRSSVEKEHPCDRAVSDCADRFTAGSVSHTRSVGQLFILLFATAALLATVRTLSPCGTWDAKFDPVPMTTSPALVLAYAIGVLVFAWYALIRVEKRPALLRFQPAFLLIVLTLFASLILLFAQGPQSALLYTFMILDDSFAHMLFWASIACTIPVCTMHARRVASLAMCVYAAASIAWLFLLGDNDTLDAPVMAVAIVAIYLLTMIVSRTNLGGAETEQKPELDPTALNAEEADEGQNQEECTALADRIAASIEERCLEIASEYRLSPRETEVLVLLAQGRTRVYIQDELVLAENTVKTHIGHIYKKLDVGNRQEMLDLVFGKNSDRDSEKQPETV